MTPEEQAHWRRVRQIFDEAADAESSERADLVALRSGRDEAVRAAVEELLDLRKQSSLALDVPIAPSQQQKRLAAEAASAASGVQALVQERTRCSSGDLIGERYRIVRFLARGGMGEVYEAVDEIEARAVALKFVRRLAAGAQPLESRFLREVRMARKIQHPNVCRIFDLIEHAGEHVCVMELLRGETLAEKLARDGKFAPQKALAVALQLCDGLQAAHLAGVLHRDLKPGNVFLEDGRAVIIDFGLAAAAVRDLTATDVSLTAPGAVIGTLAYMAPEQLEERGGVPADLYSLGVILYEMLTGEKPHDAKSPFRLVAQKARESHRMIVEMPAVWREVIRRSLKANPEDRYQSAAAMKLALERGRASARFFLTQPRILIPLLAMLAILVGWVGWRAARQDHVAPAAADARYQLAYEAMTTGAPSRAVKLLEKAVDLDPKFVNARSLLAVAHAETDQLDRAKDALLDAIAAKNRRWLLGRGETIALDAASSAVTRNYAAAAEDYLRLATIPGNREFAVLSEAQMLVQSGKFDQAIQVLEIAIAAAPDVLPATAARVRLASLLGRKGETARATAEFARAEEVYQKTGNSEGLCDLWAVRANLHNRPTAEDRADLDRAMALSDRIGNRQTYLEAKLRMVNVLQRESNYDGAIALAREVVADTQREGMALLTAQATAALGYAFVYPRRYAEALPILRESVVLAERAKSYQALAANRWRLGEVLNSLGQREEGVAVTEPAVQWYRQGNDYTLPNVLIKWGTVLGRTPRYQEAEQAFLEAYELGVKSGDELYQAMAMQRLTSGFFDRDLRKGAEYGNKAAALGRRANMPAASIAAAFANAIFGRIELANQFVAEGEALARENQVGVAQARFLRDAHSARGLIAFVTGNCAAASAEYQKGINENAGEGVLRRMRVCATPGSAPTALGWFDAHLHEIATDPILSRATVDAGDVALRAHDWNAAKRYARRGIDASRPLRLRILEMENTLILRAAEARLGNRVEADRLGVEILKIAKEVGFDNPEEFGGRQDLLYFWRLGKL